MFRNVPHTNPEQQTPDVRISMPVSWTMTVYVLTSTVGIAIAFLANAHFSRTETVQGEVALAEGIATVSPPRAGIFTQIFVEEGANVTKGAIMAVVRSEEDREESHTFSDDIQHAFTVQRLNIQRQLSEQSLIISSRLQQIDAQATGLKSEIASLTQQVDNQRSLVGSGDRDYRRAEALSERGFVSARDLDQRRESLLSRQQNMSQLEQLLASKKAGLLSLQRQTLQAKAEARSQIANLAAAQAQVEQQAASSASLRRYVLRAPINGKVVGLVARRGQLAKSETPILTIIPDNARVQAQLSVPSAAIGFVKPGQKVSLAIDSFPYQRFGTIKGTITHVAGAPTVSQNSTSQLRSNYLAIVELEHSYLYAYGKKERLLPGMTLSARIIAERQNIFKWLFEPIFAISNR